MKGKNFNAKPLTFQEFIAPDEKGRATYNNFFFNFNRERNYEMLKNIHPDLARALKDADEKYRVNGEEALKKEKVFGYCYPKSVLEKGYKAYRILREHLKDSPDLKKRISEYNKNQEKDYPDDWGAFFS